MFLRRSEPIETPDAIEPEATGAVDPADPAEVTNVVVWQAGSASWWAISVVVAGLALTLFTAIRTVSAFSEPEPATSILTAVIREPLTEAVEADLAGDDAADGSIEHSDDLIRYDIDVVELESDRAATIDAAVEARAESLYSSGIPVDPGIDRTRVGVPRRLVESLSAANHDVVGRSVLYAGILAGALLLWTLLQGRNDNLLTLPAGALATAWVLTLAGLEVVELAVSDVGPGSGAVVHAITTAAALPHQQLGFAAAAAASAAAVFRYVTLFQNWRDRRTATRGAAVRPAHVAARPVAADLAVEPTA